MADNLYKRGRIYYYNFTFDGKRYNASTGCEYKSQALRVLRQRMADVYEGKFTPTSQKCIRFEELAAKFLKWSEVHRKGTHRRDKLVVKNILPFFENSRIDKIRAKDISDYMLERREDVSSATVNREVQTLRRMYSLAITWDLINFNPATSKLITYFKEPPKTHRWVRPDEINALLSECKGKIEHLYGIIMVAVHTGLRKSEIFKLKWEHIELKYLRITVKHAKHHRNRYIPLNKEIYHVLDEIPRIGEYVFSHKDGVPIGRVDRSLATAVKKAGIKKCTLHDFRATWATELLSEGEDIETVRQLGGWRDYSTILRYLEAIPERTKQANDRLLGKYKSRHFSRHTKSAKKEPTVKS